MKKLRKLSLTLSLCTLLAASGLTGCGVMQLSKEELALYNDLMDKRFQIDRRLERYVEEGVGYDFLYPPVSLGMTIEKYKRQLRETTKENVLLISEEELGIARNPEESQLDYTKRQRALSYIAATNELSRRIAFLKKERNDLIGIRDEYQMEMDKLLKKDSTKP